MIVTGAPAGPLVMTGSIVMRIGAAVALVRSRMATATMV